MLTVFNVGQGDSLLLHPMGCLFNTPPLLIDTGSSKAKISNMVSEDELSVLLTHSHSDHIGGMPALIKNKKINKLFLPYYLPEVTAIYKFIQKHTKTTKIGQLNWNKINNSTFAVQNM